MNNPVEFASEGLPLDTIEEEPEYQLSWQKAVERLEEVAFLEDNFDLEGSRGPREECIAIARLVLVREEVRKSRAPDHISLDGDGSILLEWSEGNHRVEALIASAYCIEWMECKRGVCQFSDEPLDLLIRDLKYYYPELWVPSEDMSAASEQETAGPPPIAVEQQSRLIA